MLTTVLLLFILLSDVTIHGHKILFEDKESNNKVIKFNGKPFVVLGMQQLDCVHGKDRCLKQKERMKEKKKVL